MKHFTYFTILFSILTFANTQSLIQLLGFPHLLQGLTQTKTAKDPYGDPSTAYLIDPNIQVFIARFETRTEFCDYKCGTFYHLPCFLLFSCNIQLRDLFLLVLLPLFMFFLTIICCRKRMWSVPCWIRYVAIFSGAALLIWVVRRIMKGGEVRKRRM